MSLRIQVFDTQNASEAEYRTFNTCRNQIRAERLPDDPLTPLEEVMLAIKNLPDFIDLHIWVAGQETMAEIVGYGMVQMPLSDNLHMADMNIVVLPEFRRQGLGSRLLANIVGAAVKGERRLLIAQTYDRIPAGERFMEAVGAIRGIEAHTNQLKIADLDRQLLDRWVAQASERAGGFETGLWEGPYPQEDMEAIVALHDLVNQQPMGDLEVEDFHITEEHIRQIETSLFARGYRRWTVYVRAKETGHFAGYTEMLWSPNRPLILNQEMTGVFPEYRNRGLGRWIKAEMLVHILQEVPQAQFVRTGNADMNAPMMKINTELGFKPYMAECVWQVETERAADFVSGRNNQPV